MRPGPVTITLHHIIYFTLVQYIATCTVYIHRYAKLNATGLGCLACSSAIICKAEAIAVVEIRFNGCAVT